MELRRRVNVLMGKARTDLAELVAIRPVPALRPLPAEEREHAGRWVLQRFAELGFTGLDLRRTRHGGETVTGTRPCSEPGAPTVLLYARYDVAPPSDEAAWATPPFQLAEIDGRWHGRGTAGGKAAVVVHLTALRALGHDMPVTLALLAEGGQEQPGRGVGEHLAERARELGADAVLVCDVTARRGSALSLFARPGACASAEAALAVSAGEALGAPVTGSGPDGPGGPEMREPVPARGRRGVGSIGVETLAPQPDESVDPGVLAATATAEALFLRRFAEAVHR